MITGAFDDAGRPLIAVRYVFFDQRVVGHAVAVVDTRADRSLLNWRDAQRMGLELPSPAGVPMTGAAGTRNFHELAGELFLTDPETGLFGFVLSILVAPEDAPSARSLLGQDVLAHLAMTHDPSNNVLTFEVRHADLTLPL